MAQTKIPILTTLRFAYRDVLGDIGGFFASVWLPLAALNAVLMAAEATSTELGRFALYVLEFIVWLLIGSAFVMRWHRRVLFGEAVHSNDVLRFVRRDIRAALATLTLTVIFCIPALLLAVAAVPLVVVPSSQGAIPVFMSAALLGAIVVSGRFMLIYPLCAVDAPPSLIGTAWRMTKGNTLRLLAVMLGACIPPSVLLSAAVALLEGGIAEQPEGPLRALPAQLVQTTIWFVQIALASSAASFVFRGLGGVAAPPVSTAA